MTLGHIASKKCYKMASLLPTPFLPVTLHTDGVYIVWICTGCYGDDHVSVPGCHGYQLQWYNQLVLV